MHVKLQVIVATRITKQLLKTVQTSLALLSPDAAAAAVSTFAPIVKVLTDGL
jgi:hypothetical protein